MGTWLLIFSGFVPISLIVTLEIVKFMQAIFIGFDSKIFDEEKDMPTKVQSSNLNEELGKVEYIFSDKTGTLTKNIMEFKKMSIGNFAYGGIIETTEFSSAELSSFKTSGDFQNSNSEFKLSGNASMLSSKSEEKKENQIPNVCFEDQFFFEHMTNKSHENYQNIHNFLLHLALCHTAVLETKDGVDKIAASSPDELALVNAAKFFGYSFKGRDKDGSIIVEFQNGETIKYELLNVIEFDSTRKRMTVIVRLPDGSIKVMCKGADSIIQERLSDNTYLDQTKIYLERYASEGLRTLLLAEKTITEEDYNNWSMQYIEATLATENREEKLNEISNEIEYDFSLVGATAIEDRLQDDVAETIHILKEAGIKIWVLTGDKIETAINIGYSCKVLNNYMEQYIVNETDPDKISDQLMDAHKNFRKSKRDSHGLILAGDTLLKITEDEYLCEDFISLAEKMKVVIACRVSPKQKAEIVQLVKIRHPDKITLSIGDGANDVNMITQAHIGIGISGLEGQQAARASDYAIGQFKFLKTLILVHGRESYRRNAYTSNFLEVITHYWGIGYSYTTTYVVCFMFYKNILFVMCIFWYGVASSYSGVNIFEQWLYQLYNIVFTALPIMWFAVFDYEYPKEVLDRDPKYYIYVTNPTLTNYRFGRWVFYSVWQSCVFCLLAFIPFESQGGSLWMEGNFVFVGVVIIVNLKVLCDTNNHSFFSLLFAIGSILSFILCSATANYLQFTKLFGTAKPTITSIEFYYILVLILLAIVQVDIGVNFVNREIRKRIIVMVKKLRRSISISMFTKKEKAKRKHIADANKRMHTGFAFSQEEGNNSEIINQVLNLSLKKDLTFTGTSHTSKLLSEDLRRKRNTVFSTDRLKIESGNNKNLDVIKEDKIE